MANPLKKTMVYLGLADEQVEFADHDQSALQREPVAPAPVQPLPTRGHVTPLRRAASARQEAPSEMNEIFTVNPRQYRDAQTIAETFREGIPVIINLSQMTATEARRLIDFASGLSEGLYGKIERVTQNVFLLSPAHIVVSNEGESSRTETDSSFFAHE